MTDTVDAAFLKTSELFGSQPEEILQAIIAVGSFVRCGPGQIVVRQGDPGDCLYIVKDGVLEVLAAGADGGETTPVAYLGRGEVVGELALLTGSPRSASIRSPEHAVLFTLDKATFEDL